EAAGGIRALRDYLAEELGLGPGGRRAGLRLVLSAAVPDPTEVGKSLRAVWARPRRWSMMRRRLGGRLYAGELFVGPLPWFALAMASPSVGLKAAGAALLARRC